MSELFDDISRIVGSTMPRRQALRLIIGGLAGGAAVTLWPRQAKAGFVCPDKECPSNPSNCGVNNFATCDGVDQVFCVYSEDANCRRDNKCRKNQNAVTCVPPNRLCFEGKCVECINNSDCPPTKNVCSGNSCCLPKAPKTNGRNFSQQCPCDECCPRPRQCPRANPTMCCEEGKECDNDGRCVVSPMKP